jgi:phosphoribosyl 1,2-cyclic phosphodiesterase
MDIQIIASGSKGNCYIISDGRTSLMLECGISYRDIQKALNFNLKGISACLISHEHKDHSRAAEDILKRGILIYTSRGTIKALGVENYLLRPIENKKVFSVGSFDIMPFDLRHDCAEPFGYLIKSNITAEKLVFITDTFYCPYKFKGLTHIMIECNYIDGLTEGTNTELLKRLYKSHMSLEACLDFFKANDLSKVKEIILLHLSDARSDEKKILEAVQKETGKYVRVAGSKIKG